MFMLNVALRGALTSCYIDCPYRYGFLPLVPAMMRHPPPTKPGLTGRELIVKTLPDQSPEAYYGSLAYVMAMCRADDVRTCIFTYVSTMFNVKQPEFKEL